MIRKGLRPRIRLALDRSRDSFGFRRVFPFRRSWLAIGILALFDLIFLIPAVTTFQHAATEWGRFDDLFDLVSALFLTAWLLGWSIAPILLTTVLAILMFGREVIRVSPGKFELIIGLPGVGLAISHDVTKMRNLHIVHPAKGSGTSWRGSHAVFDYGANSGQFGSDLGQDEIAAIKAQIEMASGHTIRHGDARPLELEGDWEPESLLAEEAGSEPLLSATVDVSEPVTLASPSTIALIFANLVPLAGAAFLGWDLGYVMVLYWAESAVIGIFNVCKIVVIGRWFALFAGPFFVGHFGAFMAVHFLFVYGIFVQGVEDPGGGKLDEVMQMFIGLWPALAGLFISHGLSFFINFLGRKEYRGRSVQQQMGEPYIRIIFMHLVLIFGGGLTLFLGQPLPVLLIVIAVKIWFDIRAHLKQHAPKHP